MEKIKLKLRQTSEQDFRVTLDHREEQEGVLPAMPPELDESLRSWQSTYRQLEEVRSCIASKPGIRSMRLTPKRVMQHSGYEYADAVKTHLNQWLNSGDSQWQSIRENLILITSQSNRDRSQALVLLDVEDIRLRRLPWQEWNLFENCDLQAEIALRVKGRSGDQIKLPQKCRKVRILVVVGRSDGIRTQDDLEVIKKLKVKGAEVVSLIQPSVRELCEALWNEQGYHIFVFTGHSGSQEDGQIGWIEVNETDSLSVEEFKHALEAAIDRGLQLAIFNSCDGLGLANQLAQLNLPRSIVMREPVPDQVAVAFLVHFFEAFTDNNSLFASVHKARKQLEHFSVPQESGRFYPGVMWLPTICIRQSALDHPLTWRGLIREPLRTRTRLAALLMLGVISGAAIAGMIAFGLPQFRGELSNNLSPSLAETPANIPSGTWRYGGSTTWAPIRAKVESWIERNHPEFQLIYAQHPTLDPGSEIGIRMLLEGQLSFAESSRPLKDSEYETATLRGFRLKQVPIAIDGIAIVVHPDLQIEGLTVEQLKNIYTGQIYNWNQVGGPDLRITPISRSPSSGGTPEFFRENVLGNQNFGESVLYMGDTTTALQRVGHSANTGGIPGSIYYASAPELVGQCSVKPLFLGRHAGSELIPPYQGSLVPRAECSAQRRNHINIEAFLTEAYPLTRRLFVIIKQDGQADEQAGEAYANLLLTPEGQKLVEESGFVPIQPVH